jgi:hypothetical protein
LSVADVWGALAQSSPAATTLTDAYTVPALKVATVEVIVAERAAATAAIRISHAINGAANANAQYLLYDFAMAANDSLTTARFTMRAGDVLRVYSSTGNVSFNINGIEEDALT